MPKYTRDLYSKNTIVAFLCKYVHEVFVAESLQKLTVFPEKKVSGITEEE